MVKQTLMESIIERRNHYQGRMVEAMVNVIYFTREMSNAKPDTQERIDAKKAIAENQLNMKNDGKLMDAFDILIDQVEKDEAKQSLKPKKTKVDAGYSIKPKKQ